MANSQDPSATLEIVKELQELEQSLPFTNFQMERDGDFLGLWKDDGTIGMIGSIPSERAGNHICAILNAFPSIASLCLEQAEEINRLRGALEDARYAMDITPKTMDGFQKAYRIIDEAISQSNNE